MSGSPPPGAVTELLSDALASAGVTAVSGVEPVGGGESAQTWRFTAHYAGGSTRALVARWYVGQAWAFGDLDREDQAREAAGAVGVAVPRGHGIHVGMLAGAPTRVLVTEAVAGTVPSPWKRQDKAEIERLRGSSELVDSVVATLAGIHAATPPRHLVAADRQFGATMVQRELGRSWADLDAASFDNDPVLVYVRCWIEHQARRRPTREDQLVHCDFRLGNLVLRGERVAAVLDWEAAQSGDGLYDLGWLLAPIGHVDGLVMGVATANEVFDRYRRLDADVDLARLQLMAALATLRNMGTWAGLAVRVSGDASMNASERLRKLINALRARENVLQPILDGPEFFRSAHRIRARQPRGLAILAAQARDDVTADGPPGRALSAAISLARSLAGSPSDLPPLRLVSETARYLAELGGVSTVDESADVALSDYLRTRAAAEDDEVFGPSGPVQPLLRTLLEQWSSFPAGWLLDAPRRAVDL